MFTLDVMVGLLEGWWLSDDPLTTTLSSIGKLEIERSTLASYIVISTLG